MNRNKTPRLRFQGFAGEWERKTLGELGHCVSGVGFPESEQGGVNGIPFFKVSDMNLSDNEVILKKANHYVTEVQIAKRKWQPIEQLPCIFFAKVGAALLLNRKRLVYQHFLLDNNTMAFIMNNGLNDYFIKTLFDTIELPELAQTGALPSINAKDVENVSVLIPPPPEEQTALGDFFRRLDETLAQERARLAKTQQLKRAMLAKLFPAHGETAPKLRFKGFSGDWERKTLGEVLEIERKGKAQFQQLNAGNVPYLDADFLNGGEKFLTDAVPDVNADDVLIIWDGSNAGKVYTGFNGVLGSTLKMYRTNSACSSMFLYQELVRNEEIIFSQYRTPNIPHVVKDFSNEYTFLMPSYEEQAAIGNFFQKLDQTLALQSAALEKLTRLKKALLAAMLV
jgi:restriction modification system, specificity subunit